MTARKGGEVRELQDKLNSNQIELKLEAIRRIIDAMTRGKDVSMLFMDVIKNMATTSIQLKKLTYLYIINYAKVHPDLAIMGLNSFRKDAQDKTNPFLRALAIRTIGCIRVKQLSQFLCDPVKMALKDEDSYVRKTAVMCVPKLYDISPQLIEQQGFLKLLQNLLNDGNAMVVSNTVAALMICGESRGSPMLKLTSYIVQKLLTAMNDCNEWGIIYILDALVTYVPENDQEAESIIERISPRLAHTNAAVALSSIRLIMKYMDYLKNPESIRNYSSKISAPLITLLSREPEIAYLTLKTINLILQKRPVVIPKEIKIFSVKYHDPSYIKLEKLQIMAKVANNENINYILHELKEYTQEVDVEFVRRAIRVIGRCAIKLEKMADKCVQVLWETLKTKVNYAVQETIIVIRDIFRKYPNKYEALLKDICQNLKTLDDPEAKASIVWIIGQYVEMIENADELLLNFAEGFKDEPDVVQQQILISCVKLFLCRPADGQEIIKDLLKTITTECENPDLRDRGFIYWRLIATNPALAKKVVFSERPLISEQSYTIETDLLDRLIDNIGTLSSVYYKEPEAFVKRLKDNANAREVLDEDGEQLLQQQNQQVEFFDKSTPVVTTFVQNTQIKNGPTNDSTAQIDLLGGNTPATQPVSTPVSQPQSVDILNMDDQPAVLPPTPSAPANQPYNILDGPSPYSPQYSTTVAAPQIYTPSQPNFQTGVLPQQTSSGSLLDFGDAPTVAKNISVPLLPAHSENDISLNNKVKGLSIKAAFQRVGDKMYLDLLFENKCPVPFSELAIKFNSNAFGLKPENLEIDIAEIQANQSQSARIPLDSTNQVADIQGFPFMIEVALRTNIDMFLFSIPCSLSVVMLPGFIINIDKYKEIASNPANVKKQEFIANKLVVQQLIEKLKNNNINIVFRKQNGNNELMSFAIQLVNGNVVLIDMIFDKTNNGINFQITATNEKILPLVNHALIMIMNL